jgi:hypothetical protein
MYPFESCAIAETLLSLRPSAAEKSLNFLSSCAIVTKDDEQRKKKPKIKR